MRWSLRRTQGCLSPAPGSQGAARAANRYRVWDLGAATVRAHADVEAPEDQKPETPSAVSASTYTLHAVARRAFPFSKVRTALSKIARSASNPSGAVPELKASRHPHPLPWACGAPWRQPACTTRPVLQGYS
jgi:hypothetical protein